MNEANEGLLARLIGACPECRNGTLQAVSDGENTNFLCTTCGCCWHPELAWVNRVNPAHCPGCPEQAVCAGARRAYGLDPVSAASAPDAPVALPTDL